MGALLYVSVFVLAVGAGLMMNVKPEYSCVPEPYIILESTEIEQAEKGGTVNINTASASELTALNGVGEKLAERIVKYRDKNGRFEVKEDIMKVPGIGDKKFEAIKDCIEID